jgi:hypothetical protein
LLIDQNEPRYAVSRIGSTGPILESAKASGCTLFHTEQTYNRVLETYEDGTRLIEALIILSPVLLDVTVRAHITVGGSTFDDGTTVRDIEASEFDELGQYKLRFILPASAQTANCHGFTIF